MFSVRNMFLGRAGGLNQSGLVGSGRGRTFLSFTFVSSPPTKLRFCCFLPFPDPFAQTNDGMDKPFARLPSWRAPPTNEVAGYFTVLCTLRSPLYNWSLCGIKRTWAGGEHNVPPDTPVNVT